MLVAVVTVVTCIIMRVSWVSKMSPRVPPAPEEWDIREDVEEGEDTPRDSMHAPLRYPG